MDELLELYKRKELVEFPSWIIESKNKLNVSPQKLFMHIKKKYHILSVKLGNSDGIVLYLYRNGYYVQWTDSDRKAFIKKHIPTEIREPIHWEKVDKELLTEYANTEESELNSNENIINFRNGIFHLDTGELTPHSSEYLSTIQIPCNYNPNVRLSQAKVFMKFLDDITGGNLDDKITILELIGAIISNIKGWRYKKVIVLKGKGNTGKSKLLDLVIYLVGE